MKTTLNKITTLIDRDGLDEALICLRAVDGRDKEIRLFAVWCARQVQHLMKDQRSIEAIDVAEKYAHGLATEDELTTAGAAAGSASWDAGGANQACFAACTVTAVKACWAADDTAEAAARAAATAATTTANDSHAWYAARREAMAAQEKELRRICAEIEAAEVLQ